jgi:hypothetical protein
MMDTIRLREIAVDEGMPVGTVEKELALVCVLHALSKDPLRGHLCARILVQRLEYESL